MGIQVIEHGIHVLHPLVVRIGDHAPCAIEHCTGVQVADEVFRDVHQPVEAFHTVLVDVFQYTVDGRADGFPCCGAFEFFKCHGRCNLLSSYCKIIQVSQL